MILGLTGGIGCGKTTTARLLGARGFRVVETDALVREIYASDPEVRSALSVRYGAAVLAGPDGAVDRVALAARVFSDRAELAWLEELVHPRVRARWTGMAALEPSTRWVVEIPLLFEKGLESRTDVAVCCSASEDVQRRRLRDRGLADAEIDARLARQWPLEEKRRRARFVISNSGSREFLEAQVDALVDALGR